MLFKGKYSHFISGGCGKGITDPQEIDRVYHENLGHVFSRFYGWMKPGEIILELDSKHQLSIPRVKDKNSECTHSIKRNRDPFFRHLPKLLKLKFPELKIRVGDIESVSVCPHDQSLLLIKLELNSEVAEGSLQIFKNEDGSGTGGGDPKTRNESIYPNVSYGPSEVEEAMADIGPLPNLGKPKCQFNVGIVDKGNFTTSEHFFHVDVIRRIIEHHSYVGVVNMPMVADPCEDATIFDMVCALSNPVWLSKVDIINISQGYYATIAHPLLYKKLRCLDKIVVCSAGNEKLDNDNNGHWPSNLSKSFDHAIAVSCIDRTGQLISNFGDETVTMAALGAFGTAISGSSYAAAWMSRMIATAFSLAGSRHLTLTEVAQQLEGHFTISFNSPDHTKSKIRFMGRK